jgi:hypothetical protein
MQEQVPGHEGRTHDPGRLSKKRPGRTEIQDDPPSLPLPDPQKEPRDTIGAPLRTAGGREVNATDTAIERREARRKGAMPCGKKGSRRRRS